MSKMKFAATNLIPLHADKGIYGLEGVDLYDAAPAAPGEVVKTTFVCTDNMQLDIYLCSKCDNTHIALLSMIGGAALSMQLSPADAEKVANAILNPAPRDRA